MPISLYSLFRLSLANVLPRFSITYLTHNSLLIPFEVVPKYKYTNGNC